MEGFDAIKILPISIYLIIVIAVHKVAISGNWKVIPGGLVQISKGQQGVWGVNKHDDIYTLNSDGNIAITDLMKVI